MLGWGLKSLSVGCGQNGNEIFETHAKPRKMPISALNLLARFTAGRGDAIQTAVRSDEEYPYLFQRNRQTFLIVCGTRVGHTGEVTDHGPVASGIRNLARIES